MMTARYKPGLLDRLAPVRGSLTANAPLAKVAWFRVGGPAEVLFEPADQNDLIDFIAALPIDVPITVIGTASNLLIRDGGVPGVTIRLAKSFADITTDGMRVTAGAGAMDVTVARAARDASLTGFEFLIGIPGTIGGALRMNAGAYGAEVRDILVEATVLVRDGSVQTLRPDDMGFGYRTTTVAQDAIFLSATFEGTKGDQQAISQRMEGIQAARAETQPVKSRTGGSTFANPEPAGSRGAKAWELIDRAGCRGLTRGGAQVSPLHCNFLINTGNATAADLEGLGEEVRRRVMETSGVDLHWEIRRIGEPPKPYAQEVSS